MSANGIEVRISVTNLLDGPVLPKVAHRKVAGEW